MTCIRVRKHADISFYKCFRDAVSLVEYSNWVIVLLERDNYTRFDICMPPDKIINNSNLTGKVNFGLIDDEEDEANKEMSFF